jgi:hypothetical protein
LWWWRGRHSHPHNKKKMKIGRERKVASEHVESDLPYHRQRSPMSPSIHIIAGPNGVGKTPLRANSFRITLTAGTSSAPTYCCGTIANQRSVFRPLFRLVGERTSTRFDGNPRLSVLSKARTGPRSGLVSTHTQCDRECKL